ncbi:hypothetical protein L5M28_23740 [Shewanella sp. SW32]|uniref:hypothetical protein n=1 Tax=unclassified Shewanella TaxID=196818 RepID=UPI0021DA02A7|nr:MULTISPECIES: hypothetical protein [unclassified Shewanella]MCU7965550.1 hypothetical protein [Shewanella sp. SW32]MCU7973605.1 hypothetical protein [Shewanella sp. SW29]
MAVHILTIKMNAIKPTKHHKGWVDFELQDPTSKLSDVEISALHELLSEEQFVEIDSRFEGYSKNRGVYDYNLPFGHSIFQIEVPAHQITQACQIAENYINGKVCHGTNNG